MLLQLQEELLKKGKNGAHRGIAHEININEDGKKSTLYKDKNKIFNTPAFNYDEVATYQECNFLSQIK